MPIEPRNASELPGDLKAINIISLIVPALYNLETCRFELRGVDGEAKTNVERAFQERVLHYPQMTLTNHVNHLSQNMHTMVTQADPKTRNPSQCAAALFAANDSSNSSRIVEPSFE